MKGQTRFEYIFGVAIFAVIIIFIVNQINTTFSTIITDYEVDSTKAETLNVIKFLVEMGDIEKLYEAPVPVDIVFVNDISGSMDGSNSYFYENCKLRCDTFLDCSDPGVCADCPWCNDCDLDGYNADLGESPCSINDAKTASNIFLNQLDPINDTAGLVVFNNSAYTYQTLTNNFNLVRTAIASMNGGSSTAIGSGISRATNEILARGRLYARHIEVLLTDGVNNSGGPVENAAQNARDNGITIYVIGLGDADYLNENLLKYVAQITEGAYFNAPSSTELAQIYEDIAFQIKSEKVSLGIVVESPYQISDEKLEYLKNDCGKLDIFNLGTYRLRIYNSTQQAVFCGTDSLKPPRVSTTKYITVNNETGNITVEVW